MPTPDKLYAQFVWEDVEQNKLTRTLEASNDQEALSFAIKNHATYFTTYKSSQPDDKLAAAGARHYTQTMEAGLQSVSDIIDYLEEIKAVKHLRDDEASALQRMFGRVSRDASLQAKFTAAAAKPSATEKLDALLELMRKEDPQQLFLVPNSAGFIRLEKGDDVYGADLKRVYPAAAPK